MALSDESDSSDEEVDAVDRTSPCQVATPAWSTHRGRLATLYPFFGCESAAELTDILAQDIFRSDIERFTEIRQTFNARYKSAVGLDARPDAGSIASHIAVIRKINPTMLYTHLQDLVKTPHQSELDNYAIAIEQFRSSWFLSPRGSVSAQGNPNGCND
ncbi:hypothetical protein N0V86_005107 [Didymella sp. IMI 355093]|nr:hypothetical protein N0V86_005107 [Didymella sp. IMI 355093]